VSNGRIRSEFPLYVGGFLGPFGGGILAVLIPEIRDAFHASTGLVAAAIPAYLIPFALLQLGSGTLGERLGRRRVVLGGYIAYALASVAAAIAPTISTFLIARAAQGSANAFVTPLLLAGLADTVAPHRLGRSVGTFAAVQTAAVALSPLCGGLLGEVDWRLAFFVPAGVAAALSTLPPAKAKRRDTAGVPSLRQVFTRRVGLLSGAAFSSYAGVTGLSFLVALRCVDAFGLSSTSRGLVVAGFGVAGMIFGRAAGGAVDRLGRVPIVVAGSFACAVLVTAVGLAGSVGLLAGFWFLAGLGSALIWAGLNTLTVEAVPDNRAGATSVISSFKFIGNALAPVVFLPVYHLGPALGFLAAGIVAAFCGLFTLPLGNRRKTHKKAASSMHTQDSFHDLKYR
jgi:MFS family permease